MLALAVQLQHVGPADEPTCCWSELKEFFLPGTEDSCRPSFQLAGYPSPARASPAMCCAICPSGPHLVGRNCKPGTSMVAAPLGSMGAERTHYHRAGKVKGASRVFLPPHPAHSTTPIPTRDAGDQQECRIKPHRTSKRLQNRSSNHDSRSKSSVNKSEGQIQMVRRHRCCRRLGIAKELPLPVPKVISTEISTETKQPGTNVQAHKDTRHAAKTFEQS